MKKPQPVQNAFGVFSAGKPVRDANSNPPSNVYEVVRDCGGEKEVVGWIRHTEFPQHEYIDQHITAYLGDSVFIDSLYEQMEDGHFGYWRAKSESFTDIDKLRLKLLLKNAIISGLAAAGADEEGRYCTTLYGEKGETDGLQKAIEWIASRYELVLGKPH